MKLYELTTSYTQLQELLEGGEDEAILTTLAMLEDEIEDKAENIAKLIKNLDADAKVIKEEEQRLAERRKSIENRITYLKTYLQDQLEFAGLTKVKRPTITVSIQANPPSLNVLDESLIPSSYMIPQPPKVSKKDILAAIKNGEFIPGVEMIQGKGVRIK